MAESVVKPQAFVDVSSFPQLKFLPMRNLIIILGDQLNADSAALDDFDPSLDAI